MKPKRQGNRAAACTVHIIEADNYSWRHDNNPIVIRKATAQSIVGPKEGNLPQVDETVLCFIAYTHTHTYILLTPCLDMQFKMERLLKFSEYIKDLEKQQEAVCRRGL